jgi:hypothetical protein
LTVTTHVLPMRTGSPTAWCATVGIGVGVVALLPAALAKAPMRMPSTTTTAAPMSAQSTL